MIRIPDLSTITWPSRCPCRANPLAEAGASGRTLNHRHSGQNQQNNFKSFGVRLPFGTCRSAGTRALFSRTLSHDDAADDYAYSERPDRRRLFQSAAFGLFLGNLSCPLRVDAALVQFPVTELHNRYFLVRAGEGVREAQNRVYTNPVNKTSVDSGLSERGKRQVVQVTAPSLEIAGIGDTPWLWAGMNQRSYQTAEILAGLFQVGRNRIVPEFTFLDARGYGSLEGENLSSAAAQVAAGDLLDPSWKMPPGTDGTPNESVLDILVRVRQMMSVLETQFSDEDVVVVSPDSDNLSILQAAVLGADLRRHGEFGFRPGEARALELGTAPRDDSPARVACARPPACD
uniref:Phosphoglycerate bisphosphoglycerate mutase family protein n=1 Tax=Tetraselmis sp. GSL018 TaxID=582737 RepID=A0A061RZ05_9CHLO